MIAIISIISTIIISMLIINLLWVYFYTYCLFDRQEEEQPYDGIIRVSVYSKATTLLTLFGILFYEVYL
jgi:hypothetical protein